MAKQTYPKALSVHVYFKRTILEALLKRYPREVEFKGFDSYSISTHGLRVRWKNVTYYYPNHKIARIKVTTAE